MRVYSVLAVRYHEQGQDQLGVFSSLELAQQYVSELSYEDSCEFEYYEALAVELDDPSSSVVCLLDSPVFDD